MWWNDERWGKSMGKKPNLWKLFIKPRKNKNKFILGEIISPRN